MFWLKKWKSRGLSDENHQKWAKEIQISNNTILEKNIHAYIKMIIKIGHFVDVPCYIDDKVLSDFTHQVSFKLAFNEANAGFLQLLAVENINQINSAKILDSIRLNQLNLVKVLAPLLKTPNAKTIGESSTQFDGLTPIFLAVNRGQLETIKFLAPLTKNPNAPIDKGLGVTPLHSAAMLGKVDVIKYLAPLTENPNPRTLHTLYTPIHLAAIYGKLECVRILAPLCQYPNIPRFDGCTPIQAAEEHGYDEIKRILQSYIVS